MNRRIFVTLALAAALAAGGAAAQSLQDRLVAQLRAQGFARISVSTTLLRRTRIVAESSDQRREIIFNPRTGEILRDFWQMKGAGSGGSGPLVVSDDGDNSGPGGGGNSGHGGGDDDDDDGGDDDDDDDDDDNSGHGGGGDDDDNSGPGGGDD